MADASRVRKVEERIQQTVARMIGRRLKDPRLGFVTITDVRVTGDLQHASIFYTVLGDDADRAASARAFESAKGIIRSEVGKALGIRLTPTVEFILDALPETAAALEGALAAAREKDAQIAETARSATHAGDENPYRTAGEYDTLWDEEEDEDEPDSYEQSDDPESAWDPSETTPPQ